MQIDVLEIWVMWQVDAYLRLDAPVFFEGLASFGWWAPIEIYDFVEPPIDWLLNIQMKAANRELCGRN